MSTALNIINNIFYFLLNWFLNDLRNDRQTSERSSAAINDRRRLRELIEQLNSLNARLQPFYAQYCQYINDDPHFETTIV